MNQKSENDEFAFFEMDFDLPKASNEERVENDHFQLVENGLQQDVPQIDTSQDNNLLFTLLSDEQGFKSDIKSPSLLRHSTGKFSEAKAPDMKSAVSPDELNLLDSLMNESELLKSKAEDFK